MCSRESEDSDTVADTDLRQYAIISRSLNELYGEEDPETWVPHMSSDESATRG